MKKTTYAIIGLIAAGFLVELGFIFLERALSEPIDFSKVIVEDAVNEGESDGDSVIVETDTLEVP